MHLQNGLCILSDSRKPSCEGKVIPHRAIPDDILHTFSRVDIHAMLFSDSSAPYPHHSTLTPEPAPIPSSFFSIAECQYHLFEHFKWKWVEMGVFNDDINLSLRQSCLASQLTIWEISFAALQHRLREGPSIPEMESELVITQVYYDMFGLVSNAALTGMEISYDACYAKFERMLTLIDSLPVVSGSDSATITKPLNQKTFSFEWGVIFPLFFIAARCRDPGLRRQALARLYSLHRREGVWDNLGAARVAEKVIEIEEEGLENVQTAEDISNEKRVYEMHMVIKMDQRFVLLTSTFKSNPDGHMENRSDLVTF